MNIEIKSKKIGQQIIAEKIHVDQRKIKGKNNTLISESGDHDCQCSVFISYRRKDSRDIAARIYDSISQYCGKRNVFKDIYSTSAGENFEKVILQSIQSSKVMLVVIGTQWISVKNNEGMACLWDPRDYVRLEIELGLKNKIKVIPVLVHGAEMPGNEHLPESIIDLHYSQAYSVRSDEKYYLDINELIRIVSEDTV